MVFESLNGMASQVESTSITRRGLLSLVAVIFLVLGAGDRAGAQNLLVNGSFESPVVTDDVGFGWISFAVDDDIAGWTVDLPDGAAFGGVDLHARQNQTPWTCAHGVQALDLNRSSPGAVYQDVSFAADQWHALSFFLSANLACSPSVVSMKVLFDDTLIAEEHFETDDKTFEVLVRIDSPQEIEYYRHGGILNYVLRTKAAN